MIPSAVVCFEDDFKACIAHLPCRWHRQATRTTNLLERLLRRGAPQVEDHPERLRQKPFTKLNVRRIDPRVRAVARIAIQRLGASSTRHAPQGARQQIRGIDHLVSTVVPPAPFQQECAWTGCNAAPQTFKLAARDKSLMARGG
jgi:hypothetical protein